MFMVGMGDENRTGPKQVAFMLSTQMRYVGAIIHGNDVETYENKTEEWLAPIVHVEANKKRECSKEPSTSLSISTGP